MVGENARGRYPNARVRVAQGFEQVGPGLLDVRSSNGKITVKESVLAQDIRQAFDQPCDFLWLDLCGGAAERSEALLTEAFV